MQKVKVQDTEKLWKVEEHGFLILLWIKMERLYTNKFRKLTLNKCLQEPENPLQVSLGETTTFSVRLKLLTIHKCTNFVLLNSPPRESKREENNCLFFFFDF
jgi:hypothetical protein